MLSSLSFHRLNSSMTLDIDHTLTFLATVGMKTWKKKKGNGMWMTLISFLPWEHKEPLLQTHTWSWGSTVEILNVLPFLLGCIPDPIVWIQELTIIRTLDRNTPPSKPYTPAPIWPSVLCFAVVPQPRMSPTHTPPASTYCTLMQLARLTCRLLWGTFPLLPPLKISPQWKKKFLLSGLCFSF